MSVNRRRWQGAAGRAGKRHVYGQSGGVLSGRIRVVLFVLRLGIHSEEGSSVPGGRAEQGCGRPMKPGWMFSFSALLSYYYENDSGPLTCLHILFPALTYDIVRETGTGYIYIIALAPL